MIYGWLRSKCKILAYSGLQRKKHKDGEELVAKKNEMNSGNIFSEGSRKSKKRGGCLRM
jgi:hypothetical protein